MDLKLIGVIAIVIVLVVGAGIGIAGCETIEPGYVGIKVNLHGTDQGVEDYPILTGRQFHNPFTERIYEFPTFIQNVVWTQDPTEGSQNDESITFNSGEGASIQADIALAYSFDSEKVPDLFVEFRKEAEAITDGYMRGKVRDAFNRAASGFQASDIFGAKKSEVLKLVMDDLQTNLGPKGFKFDMVSFIGGLRADPQVMNSINAVIQANQKAIEAENKVAQSKAEADQKIEEARGKAESQVLEAEAEAKAILAKAEAQAKANDLQAKSITPELLQWNALQRWDGVLPQFMGGDGAVPFITLTPDSKDKKVSKSE